MCIKKYRENRYVFALRKACSSYIIQMHYFAYNVMLLKHETKEMSGIVLSLPAHHVFNFLTSSYLNESKNRKHIKKRSAQQGIEPISFITNTWGHI